MLRVGDTVRIIAPFSLTRFHRHNEGTIVSLNISNGINSCNEHCGENVGCCKVMNNTDKGFSECFWIRNVELVKGNKLNV